MGDARGLPLKCVELPADGSDVGTSRQRSRRGAAFAVLFLVLAGGAAFQGWRSQTHFDSFRWRGLAAMTAEGKACLLWSDSVPDGPIRNGVHTVPYHRAEKGSTIIQWPAWSFSFSNDVVRREHKLTVVSPLWFIAALCAIPPAYWLLRGRNAARIADEMD